MVEFQVSIRGKRGRRPTNLKVALTGVGACKRGNVRGVTHGETAPPGTRALSFRRSNALTVIRSQASAPRP